MDRCPPPFPEGCDPSLESELLSKFAMQTWRQAAPNNRAVPIKPWVTEEVWVTLRRHAEVRRAYFDAVRETRLSPARSCFVAWRFSTQHPARSNIFQDKSVPRLRFLGLAPLMKIQAKIADTTVQESRNNWVKQRAEAIKKDIGNNRPGSLWDLVRSVTTKAPKARVQPRLHLKDGTRALTVEQQSQVWVEVFSDEFMGRVEIMDREQHTARIQDIVQMRADTVPPRRPQETSSLRPSLVEQSASGRPCQNFQAQSCWPQRDPVRVLGGGRSVRGFLFEQRVRERLLRWRPRPVEKGPNGPCASQTWYDDSEQCQGSPVC